MKTVERFFINACIICMIIGLFVECKGKDTTLKSKTNQSTEIQNNISQLNISASETLKTESSKESSTDKINTDTNENTSIIQNIVEYDTSQPKDPETGKHPVKKETINYINSEKGSKQSAQSDKQFDQTKSDQTKKKDESTSNDNSKQKQNTQSDIDLKEDTGLNWYQEMSVWIVTSLIIVVGLWLLWKYREKIFGFRF